MKARIRKEQLSSVPRLLHDLRNTLSVILSSLQYLRVENGVTTSEGEQLGAIDDAIAATGMMTRWLVSADDNLKRGLPVAAVRPSQLRTKPLINEIHRDTKALVRGRNIDVSLLLSRAPELLICDRHVMERVVMNLCSNAAKYTTEGHILISAYGERDYLVVAVSDSGCGISSERLPDIFRPRTSDSGGHADSWGLGLSVVVALLHQIGGRLEVASVPDFGSTFWAYFPTNLDEAISQNVRTARADVVRIRGDEHCLNPANPGPLDEECIGSAVS